MPKWIECPDCREEFKDKPGLRKCPECGARIDRAGEEEDWDDDDAPRSSSKKKEPAKSKAMLFALIGVGVLAVALVVVLILLFTGGPKADPSKVTLPNFQKLQSGMTQGEAEALLGGSSSSSLQDMQTEVSKALGAGQANMDGVGAMMTAMFTGGEWRRWDGKNLVVWVSFGRPLFGGGKDTVVFSLGLEKLADGGYKRHGGVGNVFGDNLPGAPKIQIPPMPQVPQPKW